MAQSHRSRQIVIAGAGIAGLTAAIAFARLGFSVRVFEQAPELQEAGAGVQLSPNATRVLDALGVLDHLAAAAVAPERISIRRARNQKQIAALPLGAAAEKRWGAPYLAVHRADLQTALLAQARREPDVRIITGARVSDAALHARGATVSVDEGSAISEVACLLLVGADGVHSSVRMLGGGRPAETPSGHTAWRTTVSRGSAAGTELSKVMPEDEIGVFLNQRFHLVSYPIRAGTAINLVAVTQDAADTGKRGTPLEAAMRGLRGPLKAIATEVGPWTRWPIHVVDPRINWTGAKGVALIGDAAHAMTPFAAQGAAMAIEDAAALAMEVASRPGDVEGALAAYEALRRPRIVRVSRRGSFNRFVWHAGGPIAWGRNMVLGLRTGDRLAADLDWLYGYDVADGPEK